MYTSQHCSATQQAWSQVFDAHKAAVREVQRLLQHPDSLKTLPALLEENTRRLQV